MLHPFDESILRDQAGRIAELVDEINRQSGRIIELTTALEHRGRELTYAESTIGELKTKLASRMTPIRQLVHKCEQIRDKLAEERTERNLIEGKLRRLCNSVKAAFTLLGE